MHMRKILREKIADGAFSNVPDNRKRIMSSIRSKGNISTEISLRCALVRGKMTGWKVHPIKVYGNPDFYFPGARVAIFTDGCFWHGCLKCGHIPRTNEAFWEEKIRTNQCRDANVNDTLMSQNIKVVRFWEHELVEDIQGVVDQIRRLVKVE